MTYGTSLLAWNGIENADSNAWPRNHCLDASGVWCVVCGVWRVACGVWWAWVHADCLEGHAVMVWIAYQRTRLRKPKSAVESAGQFG